MHKVKYVFVLIVLGSSLISCKNDNSQTHAQDASEKGIIKFPSDAMPSLNEWVIMLANGETIKDLKNFENQDYFFAITDDANWVVYKAPNGGVTSPNSHNTRTELGQKKRWTPKEGGKLNGTLKVMHVSKSGDARVGSSYSVVVGQIHSDDGHKNEPIKIFYKKFPGHSKGSVFWNYEINTAGDNSKRWDYSTPVWGHEMTVVGTEPNTYPAEPKDGIALGEEFNYEINVFEGVMHLTFISEGHPTKTYTKNLIESEYASADKLPQQILTSWSVIGRDGTEKPKAYAGETQYFKQGAYNQTNGKDPASNMLWSSGAETFNGDLKKQYAHGDYTEVWFRESIISKGTAPEN